MEETAIKILKERNLKVTTQRLLILAVLLTGYSKAYSSSDLLRSLEDKMNRSTVYRSMEALLINGVVKKLVDKNGETIYSLNLGEGCKHSHHPHLKCDECGVLECLPDFPNDYLSLLEKSGVDEVEVVLGGVCSSCSKIEEENEC